MKRIFAGLVALSVLAGTTASAVAAPNGWYTVTQVRYDNDRGDRNDNRGNRYDNRNNRYDNRGWDRGQNRYQMRQWRRGERIDRYEWNRAHRVDYRAYHLRRPHRGYEWRYVNGQYVEAAIVGGLIASVIIAASR